jgi:hypothetical protein
MKIICEKKKLIAILTILIGLVLIIVAYGLIMKTLFKGDMILKDFMNYKLFDLKVFGADCCSLWPFSHLILYTILAFFFPDCLITLFIIGVIWELIEISGDVAISKFSKKKNNTVENKNLEYKGNWIQGNFKDIIFNTIGLALGFGLRKGYDSLKKKKNKK